jgi:hypothetical protein
MSRLLDKRERQLYAEAYAQMRKKLAHKKPRTTLQKEKRAARRAGGAVWTAWKLSHETTKVGKRGK